ncbi:basic amino acid ABC transporter substrate-binding protein [Aquibacillus koreensis]
MNKYVSGLYLTLIMIGLLFLAACGTADDATADSNAEGQAEENAEKPVLRVGTEATFAPFEFLEKGEIVGFDADLLDAVLTEAGYEYEYENVGWDPMMASLQNKDMDFGAAAITINDDRKQTYDFSVPYFKSTHMIVFNEGAGFTSAKDLEGIKIGVQNGTTGESAAEKVVGEKNSNILKYDSTAVAFLALKNGDVDAVVTDNVVADEYVEKNPDANVEAITDDETFSAEYYGFMFPKGSELVAEVDAALTTVIENGTYAKIYKEWFGAEPNTDVLLEAAE